MKALVSFVVVALAMAFTVPAFAGGGSMPQTQAECEKAGHTWDSSGKKCVAKE
jgi:hypothetical protein